MGGWCSFGLRCTESPDEGKSLLNASGNTDINRSRTNMDRSQTSIEEIKKEREKDDSCEERKSRIENQQDPVVTKELSVAEGTYPIEPSPKSDISCADVHGLKVVDHTCKNPGEISQTRTGCVKISGGPMHDISAEALRQQVEDVPVENHCQDVASIHGGSPAVSKASSRNTENDCKEVKSSKNESLPSDLTFLVPETQQPQKNFQEEEAQSEDVPHLNSTHPSDHAALWQTHPGDPGVIAPMMCPNGNVQKTGDTRQDGLLEPAGKLVKTVASTKASGDEQKCVVNYATKLETPKLEEQFETQESNPGNEDFNWPVDLQEVPSLEALVEKEPKQQKRKHEQENEDEKEEGGSAEASKVGALKRKLEDGTLTDVQAEVPDEAMNEATAPSTELETEAEVEGQDSSEEDLYRGEDEIIKEQNIRKMELLNPITSPEVQEKCSVTAGVDVLLYSQQEWRGNTAKCILIKKGYEMVAQNFGSLRRVRGDNYCALRATLFQVLTQTEELPVWIQEEGLTLLPEKLLADEEMAGLWRFPLQCRVGESVGAVEQLKHSMKLLRNTFQEAAQVNSVEEREKVCEQVFQGGQEEYELLEALKLLMLRTAMDLHARMQCGEDVPFFCWLFFARDSSGNPSKFLANHLSRVGFTGGLEQVEMFLLGYTLQRTIQVYRLYKMDTEEFVTYYPNDHKEDWPCVSLVTEDDRHYNVPGSKLAESKIPEALAVSSFESRGSSQKTQI